MMAAVLPPVFTVLDVMIACGLTNVQATRVATQIFGDDFDMVPETTMDDIGNDFKTLRDLSAVNGQVRLNDMAKRRIKAFIQWTRDEVRMGRNPSRTALPVADTAMLIRRMNLHDKYVEDAKTMSAQA